MFIICARTPTFTHSTIIVQPDMPSACLIANELQRTGHSEISDNPRRDYVHYLVFNLDGHCVYGAKLAGVWS